MPDHPGEITQLLHEWRAGSRQAEDRLFELVLPDLQREPRMLYVLTGSGYDAAKGEVTDPYLRWVVYTPYATPESTGLSTTPGPGPWLMYPGTPGAHIMISPPKK